MFLIIDCLVQLQLVHAVTARGSLQKAWEVNQCQTYRVITVLKRPKL